MSTTPTQKDIDDVLREFDDLARLNGDEVVGRVSDETEDGKKLLGRQIQHGDQSYSVLALVGEPMVRLQYSFDAAKALAVNRAVADGGQPTAAAQHLQVGPEDVQNALDDIRDTVDGDEVSDIQQGLVDRISHPEYAASFNAEGEFVYGFTVSAKTFPFEEEEVSISEYSEKAQGVVSLGWKGQQFLTNQYGLQDLLDTASSAQPRGFQ